MRPREGVGDRGRGGKLPVQACRVVGDIVCGGGTHVGDVAGGVPLTVAPGARVEGHEVLVLAVGVPWIKEKRRVKQGG